MTVSLLRAAQSTLLIIDEQERLLPAIHEGATVLESSIWLTRVAAKLGIPILASEQYPKGLGKTIPALAAHLPEGSIREKVHFSCVAERCFIEMNAFKREQFVLAGTETHVCVLQTAIDLRSIGKQVFVVLEAVGSRTAQNRDLGLQRMRDHGVEIVSREMVAFEWLHRAGTEIFREVSRELIR